MKVQENFTRHSLPYIVSARFVYSFFWGGREKDGYLCKLEHVALGLCHGGHLGNDGQVVDHKGNLVNDRQVVDHKGNLWPFYWH